MWPAFYGFLADFVLVLHVCFILFVVLGGLLVLRWPGFAWAHLPAAVWGIVVETTGWICPLTPLEVSFRRAAGGTAYDATFVERYLVPLVYPSALTREMQVALGGFVLLVNVVIYGIAARRALRRA
jgi:hypothetical protein